MNPFFAEYKFFEEVSTFMPAYLAQLTYQNNMNIAEQI